jgi:thiol-disulfide isomerase/thioredoxin
MPSARFAIRLLPLLALAACRAEEAPEGIRPEISALPPDQRPQPPRPPSAMGGETWNAAQIDWQPYEAGLAKAKAQNKPVLLVFFTNWCPHCRNYSHVFDDPRVVERAKGFVMIHANADDESEVAGKYLKDGGYVPRTFFLAPDGSLQADIHAPRPKFQYFFDEKDPGSILAAMDTAAERAKKQGG